MTEPCEICGAKDAEIFQLTAHVARLTQMIAQDHELIMILKYELTLEREKNDRRTNERAARLTTESATT
jgi:hypothetical protein